MSKHQGYRLTIPGSTILVIRTVASTLIAMISEISEGSDSAKYTGCAWDFPTLFTARTVSKVGVKSAWKMIARTQDADLNFKQGFLELFPTTVIRFGNIENNSLALDFSLGTRRCVKGRLGLSGEEIGWLEANRSHP